MKMEKDTLTEPEERDLDLPTPRWIPLSDRIKRPVAGQTPPEQTIEVAGASREHLRWRLVLLVGLRLTQEKYVAWLRQEPQVDAQCLAAEEVFLAYLVNRVRRAVAALKKAVR